MEKKLLLVDDEADIREVLGLYLRDSGYEVVTAEDGRAGLEAFQRERPPLVLTDIRMPGLDGIALLREVKALDPEAEVIMVTGHGDLDSAIQSLKHEATDFITKPINHQVLELAVTRAWERHSLRARVRAYNERLQQMVQEELRAARHKYHQLFDVTPCFITLQDRDFRITEHNRLFEDHFGRRVGQRCFEVYRHAREVCTECPVARTFEDGASHQMETVLIDDRRRALNVLIHTAPIRDADGRISQVMRVATDITRIRELQDHLTSLGLLVGSVSHGIKGLLTGLDSAMYLLNSGFTRQNPDQVRQGWDVLQLMVGRIRKQVLDILYYAKNRELNLAETDLRTFAEGLCLTVEAKAADRGIVFERRFDTDLGVFDADADVLAAALVNVLENAVDACAEKKEDGERRVAFEVGAEGGEVRFVVSDTGVGIDRETREKMFTLFFSSKGTRGTGLGLFITHTMVRQHGGRILVESEPGRGSRFDIRVPRRHEARPATDPEEPAS